MFLVKVNVLICMDKSNIIVCVKPGTHQANANEQWKQTVGSAHIWVQSCPDTPSWRSTPDGQVAHLFCTFLVHWFASWTTNQNDQMARTTDELRWQFNMQNRPKKQTDKRPTSADGTEHTEKNLVGRLTKTTRRPTVSLVCTGLKGNSFLMTQFFLSSSRTTQNPPGHHWQLCQQKHHYRRCRKQAPVWRWHYRGSPSNSVLEKRRYSESLLEIVT